MNPVSVLTQRGEKLIDGKYLNNEIPSNELITMEINDKNNIVSMEDGNGFPDIHATICIVEGETVVTPATTVINIDGVLFTAVVDTGACDSIISYKHVNMLRMLEHIKQGDRKLIDANGKQIPLLGTIEMPVLFGNTIRNWTYWVANNANTPMLLGMNILKQAVVDGPAGTIQIEGDTQQLRWTKPKPTAYCVRSSQQAIVPPASSMWLKGQVTIRGNTIWRNGSSVEYEGKELSSHCNVVDALVKIQTTENTVAYIDLEIINESDQPYVVTKGTAMGRLLGKDESINIFEDKIYYQSEMDYSTMHPYKAQERKYSAERKHKHGWKSYCEVGESTKQSCHVDTMGTLEDPGTHGKGKVDQGQTSPCLEGTDGDLPEKMAGHWPFIDREELALSETLGDRWTSDNVQQTTKEGTPSRRTVEQSLEMPVDIVQGNEQPGQGMKDDTESRVDIDSGVNITNENYTEIVKTKEGEKECLYKLVEETDLSTEEKGKLKELLDGYLDIFSNNLSMAGMAKLFPHIIRLNTDVPLWTAQHRRSWKENEVIDAETRKLAAAEVVRQSKSPYNSPVMVVKKKDGDWRTVIDYREINKITYKEAHPIPRADEAFDALGTAKYITTLDFTSGYWQVPVREEDKHKTAYSTSSGRWEYNVLPMGLTNAPAAFQRNMEVMLAGMLWQCCIVYIDDVIIYSSTFAEHLEHLENVFKRLRTYNVHAKPAKCKLVRREVEYLGHVVGRGVVKPNEMNTNKVRQAKLPTSVKEIRQFNGIASYYRRFIPGFAKIAKPLTDLMAGKNRKLVLPEEAIKAYEAIKVALTTEPVLILPDFTKKFSIRTDASKYAVGGVLFQLDEEGKEHPVQYTSRVLSTAETHYSATEREMLGVYYCIRHWRPYVFGQKFTVYTDHKPLRGIRVSRDITGRLARMILKLQEYEYTLEYTPGKENGVADALSREPLAGCNSIDGIEYGIWAIAASVELPKQKPTRESLGSRKRKKFTKGYPTAEAVSLPREDWALDIAEAQVLDESLSRVRAAAMKKGTKKWTFINDCLHKVKRDRKHNCERLQLVVPKKMRERVMEAHHDMDLAGHMGIWKTLNKIARWYYWPEMAKDVKKWVAECVTCQQYKGSGKEKYGELQPIRATRPFEIVGMDILTDLPLTGRGNKHILVFTDYFTKWPEAIAIPDLEAKTVARAYFEHIIVAHGAPSRIITDRGSQFVADVFRELTELLGTKHSMTTAYHPQTDGQAERMVGTLSTMLGKLTGMYQAEWDVHIPYALYAYRTAVHATTGETPFFLVYGRDDLNPSDIRLRQWIDGKKSVKSYSRGVVQRLLQARERVIKESNKQKKRNESAYNKGRIPPKFKEGDVVWLRVDKQKVGDNRKLKPKWTGPYRIIFMVEGLKGMVVDIQHTANPDDKQRINVNRLKMAFLRAGTRVAETEQPVEQEVIEEKIQNKEEEELQAQEKEIQNPTGMNIWSRGKRNKDPVPVRKLELQKKDIEKQENFEIEAIIDEREGKKGKEYKVKWKGWNNRYNQWINNKDMNAPKIVAKWNSSIKGVEKEKDKKGRGKGK